MSAKPHFKRLLSHAGSSYDCCLTTIIADGKMDGTERLEIG